MVDCCFPIPPQKENAVVLVCCGDSGYIGQTGVLFRSVLDHADPHRFYDLIYLHNGIDETLLAQLHSLADGMENASVRTCNISSIFHEDSFYTENRSDLPAMTFARLLIPDVLSPDYHRALYLDGDMIALRDVAPCFDSDLKGQPLGCTTDFFFCAQLTARLSKASKLRAIYAKKVLGIRALDEYFIAGTLLLDLDLFRRDFPTQLLLATAASRKWPWHDQDALNFLLRAHKTMIDPIWQTYDMYGRQKRLPEPLRAQFDRTLQAPGIYHFAGSAQKPWKMDGLYMEKEFWDTARRTPFYDSLQQLKQRTWRRHCLRRNHRWYIEPALCLPLAGRYLPTVSIRPGGGHKKTTA